MPTPDGTIIIARKPDGTEVDVTEGVQAAFDLATSSMDFGSGFWSIEETIPIEKLARECGFDGVNNLNEYIAQQRENDERNAFQRKLLQKDPGFWYSDLTRKRHSHEWSSLGNCLYPGCYSKRKDVERPVVP